MNPDGQSQDSAMIDIVFDSRRHYLLFDDNAVLRARDQFGFDIRHALTQQQSRYNLCVLVCCGLSHEQPAPGFKAIKKLITPEHAVEDSPAWVAVGQALDRWQRTRKETEHHG